MTDVDADQVSGTVGASQPGGVVEASQPSGTVGARLAQPQANLWTPAQLGSDLALWLDRWGSTFQTRTDSDGNERVEVWGDRSGNGNDVVQTAGNKQPILQTDRLNFALSDTLLGPSGSYVYSGNFQWHVLVSQTNLSRSQPFGLDDPSGTDFLGLGPKDGGDILKYYTNAETRTEGPSVLTGFHIYSSIWNGSRFLAQVDGSDHFTEDTNGSGWQNVTQPIINGPLDSKAMDIFAVVLAQKNDDVDRIQGWAAHAADRELGITEPLNNLPSSHPYKDSPPLVA